MFLKNVSFKITLSPEQAVSLKTPNGWVYAEGGNCGLIVYNADGRTVAYDRCAAGKSSKLTVDGFVAVDSESGAKWLLKDGTPIHIAECPLQSYSVRKEGEFIIVSN